VGVWVHAGAVRDGAWHAHDAVLEMLNLHDQGRGRLGGGEDTSNTMGVVNDSYPGASSGRGAAASSATGTWLLVHSFIAMHLVAADTGIGF
jgi:hypothetical protein